MGNNLSSEQLLNRLVGNWVTEVTHPALPGVVVPGTVAIEWLEGERFLIHRFRNDHPDFPDSIAIIGSTDADRVDAGASTAATSGDSRLSMHYFDSRGVFRVYDVAIDNEAWHISREAPEFSQRFVGTFADGGRTIDGLWRLRQDGGDWNDDLRIIYRRSFA
jgi:hypothetical protein